MAESGIVVWFTGLPAAGKSSAAQGVRKELAARGRDALVLDGDEVRGAFGCDFGYDPKGRALFYSALAGTAGLLARQGHIVLVAATAPLRSHRRVARAAAPAFLEVYVATPVAVCASRDPKGLYAAAEAGEIEELPGMDVGYEIPVNPDVIIGECCSRDALARIAELADLRTHPTNHTLEHTHYQR